jgi:uncharacterized RDD family membrane protein YckC
VSRWTGSWLSGGGAPASQDWPGERLGLPQTGPGSVASRGARLGALLLDLVIAALVTSLFVRVDVADPDVMRTFNYWSLLVWFVISVGAVGLFGFTAGMAALGIRVARLDGATMVGPLRAIPRAALTAVLIPAVIWDADSRGLHDKAVGTVVVRTR